MAKAGDGLAPPATLTIDVSATMENQMEIKVDPTATARSDHAQVRVGLGTGETILVIFPHTRANAQTVGDEKAALMKAAKSALDAAVKNWPE